MLINCDNNMLCYYSYSKVFTAHCKVCMYMYYVDIIFRIVGYKKRVNKTL